ncbi:hypothetical protein OTSGILL_0877 [Orientia tsutsugamushi str. Gilliam]|uniref:Uncharacterized protein n=1 Tax=Orientia tsutsugamushi str. Gilliam TaxID=1359184 RepID=A0A0F3MCN8_ORITS|nr:hypothetical protein OTSGILL_0877 [Orientia tsutsugamushi str. Gilliam]
MFLEKSAGHKGKREKISFESALKRLEIGRSTVFAWSKKYCS